MTDKQRIGKVTTRAGDSGNSKLATGRTVAKHAAVFQAIGAVDELNSHVGLLLGFMTQHGESVISTATLKQVQQDLFDIGAVLAMEGQYAGPQCETLETEIEALNAALPPLTEFVLPGGGVTAAQSHVCRTVCRRGEADLWRLLANSAKPEESLQAAAQYLNRLSDYFFVLARTLTATAEEQWRGPDRA